MSEHGDQDRQELEKSWMALLLACVAGCVDGVGYLVLFHLFTAHMSGNSVAFGIAISEQHWSDVLRHGIPIPLYVVGAAMGALAIEVARRRSVRRAAASAIALEMLFLLAFLLYGNVTARHHPVQPGTTARYYLLVALLVLAMGVQTAILRRAGGASVRTTFITGIISNFAEACVTYLLVLHDRLHAGANGAAGGGSGNVLREPSLAHALLYAGIWIAYMGGAIGGGAAELRWGIPAVCFPLGALACLLARVLWRPLDLP